MAPSAASNSTSPVLTPVARDLTEFINGVAASLLPIITLFGELFTKQFLSLSMGWADNVLLAACPVGIITIITSAIRVAGYRWLKALIGRARENKVKAEQEFMSSTSEEVWELWSGREIVRVTGKPSDTNDMKTLVVWGHVPPDSENYEADMVYFRLESAAKAYDFLNAFYELHDIDRETVKKHASEAPNLTLNVPDVLLNRKWLWFLAYIVALSAQVATLVIPALATYQWRWPRKGVPVARYAYICFAVGTIAIFLGLLICGRVIEDSTTELLFRSKDEKDQVMSIPVDSQHFSSFAILLNPTDRFFRTSRVEEMKIKKYGFYTLAACLLSLAGFLAQFIGLGGLHWSATVTMLVSSLTMTGIRAWAWQGLAKDPVCFPIPEKVGLAWVAHRVVRNDWAMPLEVQREQDCYWCIPTGFVILLSDEGTSIGSTVSAGSEEAYSRDKKAALAYTRQLSRFASEDNGSLSHFSVSIDRIPRSQCPEIKAAKDLLSTSPNLSPVWNCADVAARLADALEGFVSILWDLAPGRTAREIQTLNIDVQKSFGVKATWSIRLMPGQMKDDLTAGLSLWVYSLACGSDWLSTQLLSDDIFIKQNELDYSKLSPGSLSSWIRILGNSEHTSAQRMTDWMVALLQRDAVMERFEEIPAYDGEWRKRSRSHRRPKYRAWPVFGLYHSATFEIAQYRNATSDPYFSLELPSVDDTTKSWQRPADCGRDIICSFPWFNTVEEECALEILSLCLLSLCQRIDRSKFEAMHKNEKMGLLRNLAQKMDDAKLTAGPRQALMLVISAFARLDLMGGIGPDQKSSGQTSSNGE